MNWERVAALIIFILAGAIAFTVLGYKIGEQRIINQYEDAVRICRDL